MAQDSSRRERVTPRRAQPVTALLARRVQELRKAAGMTPAALGEAMAAHRPGWSRSTVVKLENLSRETLPVDDLVALALVLDVPPVALLADPTSSESTPVTADIAADPWSIILWAAGARPLAAAADATADIGDGWGTGGENLRRAIASAQQFERLLDQLREVWAFKAEPDGPFLGDVDDDQAEETNRREARILAALSTPLRRIQAMGYITPAVPDEVRQRAEQVGVQLPAPDES